VNGYPRDRETFAHVEGYVEDIMAYAPYLTVREGIEYSAAMRLSKKFEVKERKCFAEEVIQVKFYRSLQARLSALYASTSTKS